MAEDADTSDRSTAAESEAEWSASVRDDGLVVDDDNEEEDEEDDDEEDELSDEEEDDDDAGDGSEAETATASRPRRSTRRTLQIREFFQKEGEGGDMQEVDGDGEPVRQPSVAGGKKRKKRASSKDDPLTPRGQRNRNRRRKIATIMDDQELEDSTLKARDAERARASRIDVIFDSFAQLSEDQLVVVDGDNTDEAEKPAELRVCLNLGPDGAPPTGEPGTEDAPVFTHPAIAGKLKPHQVIGARFMWSHVAVEPNGFGCVLADFMGLGKTLQVITVVQAFLALKKQTPDGDLVRRHKHVLILAPTICVRNWEAEVVKWIGKNDARKIGLQTLDSGREKQMIDRVQVVQKWYRRGGLLIMGYELYRILALQSSGVEKVSARNARHLNQIKQAYACLCDPGPDLMVLDEGHRVRDHKSKLVKALSHAKTARRIILTGYPLQNHLEEYWTMVNFARPDYLGSLDEFKNRFVDPIENGQCMDSSESDLRLARQRAYVLTRELKPLVLRRDQQYLFRQLPPKKEWVLFCQLSDAQVQLYRSFLEQGVPKRGELMEGVGGKVDVLGGYHISLSISNHPDVLHESFRQLEEEQQKTKPKGNHRLNMDEDEDDDMFGLNDSDDTGILQALNAAAYPRAKPKDMRHRMSFAESFMQTYERNILESSGKMVVLMEILAECQEIGDRVILFSQSIPTLNTIERMIAQANKLRRRQSKRLTYLRIDGSTPQQERFRQIGQFNDLEEDVDMIMISTKAGGEGINLCAGNRIVIFDVCWNPCNDSQSMCRSYRFGQTKPVFVYRFVSACTMEKKVYDLQIRKEGVAKRIVDEKTMERKFKTADLQNYFNIDEFEQSLKHRTANGEGDGSSPREPPKEDVVLEKVLAKMSINSDDATNSGRGWILDWFEQETMFEEDLDQQCTPTEQKEIMETHNYLKAIRSMRSTGNYIVNREGVLAAQCQHCRFVNEIYPESITNVPVPKLIDCSLCKRPTLTEGAVAPPAQSGIPGAIGGFQYGRMFPPGVLQPSVDTGSLPVGSNPSFPGRSIPPHLVAIYQQQTANLERQRLATQQAQQAQAAARQAQFSEREQKMRREIRAKMKLKDRHLLILRRGMKGCQDLKRQAEGRGASLAIEVNSQLTDIVSATGLEETLKWLHLSKLPKDVDFRSDTWLRNEIATETFAAQAKGNASTNGAPAVATQAEAPAEVSNDMIDLIDSDDEMDGTTNSASETPPQAPAIESNGDDEDDVEDNDIIEIL